jgi:hypothetical protein
LPPVTSAVRFSGIVTFLDADQQHGVGVVFGQSSPTRDQRQEWALPVPHELIETVGAQQCGVEAVRTKVLIERGGDDRRLALVSDANYIDSS